MKVQCPHCGGMVTVNGLGRKAFQIPVTKVCDALRGHHSVTAAASELGCSRAYIYKVLKAAGLTPANMGVETALDLLKAKAIPRAGKIYKTKEIKAIFGYSQHTYLKGTRLFLNEIIAKVPEGWLIHATKDNRLLHNEGLNDRH